jgi:hypothetical protein
MKRDNLDSGNMVPDLTNSSAQFYRYSREIEKQKLRLGFANMFEQTGPIRIVLIKRYGAFSEPECLKRFPPEGFVSDIDQQICGAHVFLF